MEILLTFVLALVGIACVDLLVVYTVEVLMRIQEIKHKWRKYIAAKDAKAMRDMES
jgi:hypothetical protein